MPRCGGSQVAAKPGEQPKLRGYAAAQVVVVQLELDQLVKQPELRGDGSGQAAVAPQPARGAPEREEGWREVPVGASDPRRAADTRCAPPLRDATTLRHHPYARAALRPLPAPLSQPLSANRYRPPSAAPRSLAVHGGRCNGAHSLVSL